MARKLTSKYFGTDPLYQRFLNTVLNSESTRAAATRLGVSASTVRRWTRQGLPTRRINVIASTIKRADRNTRRRVRNAIQRDEFYESRPVSYYRYFGGVRTKYYIVTGTSYESMLDIIMRECEKFHDGKINYAGFRFRIKLNAPFSGLYDGEGGFTSADSLKDMSAVDRKIARESSSWIETTLNDPFLSSRVFPFLSETGECRNPNEYVATLDRYYLMKNVDIQEIIFSEIRGDEETGKPIDFYSSDF